MDKVNAAKDGAMKVWDTAKTNPARTVKVLSVLSGVLLILGGFYGMFNIFNPLRAVLSVYNLLFGALIIVTELKSWPIISTFQKRIDVYFHLLSSTRGKGSFYCFIGFLAFCASVQKIQLDTICVLIVTIVGVLHLLPCSRASIEPTAGAADESAMSGKDTLMPGQESSSSSAFAASSGFSDFAMQVVKDNPGMVNAGLQFAANNPDLAQQGVNAACAAQPR